MADLEELRREARQRGEALPDEMAAVSSGTIPGDVIVQERPVHYFTPAEDDPAAVWRVLFVERARADWRGWYATAATAGWTESFNIVGRVSGMVQDDCVEIDRSRALELLRRFGGKADEYDSM